MTAVVQICSLRINRNREGRMRWRTIMKGHDTGRLNRAEVRAAIEAVGERRRAARSGSVAQQAPETPRVPIEEHAPEEAP